MEFERKSKEEIRQYMKTWRFRLQIALIGVMFLLFLSYVGFRVLEGLGVWK